MAFAGIAGSVIGDPTGTPITMAVSRWKVNDDIVYFPVTNSEGNGFREGIEGIKSNTVELEIPWNSSTTPVAQASPGIAGDLVELKLQLSTGQFFQMTGMLITHIDVEATMEGATVFNMVAERTGTTAITYPV